MAGNRTYFDIKLMFSIHTLVLLCKFQTDLEDFVTALNYDKMNKRWVDSKQLLSNNILYQNDNYYSLNEFTYLDKLLLSKISFSCQAIIIISI